MKNIEGVWLPDHETHLYQFAIGKGWKYQSHKLSAAMKYVEKKDFAIDIGGHCGLWSMSLVNLFDEVAAFEPVQEHRECYERNVEGNYTLYPYGLGNKEMKASIHTDEGSSGDSWVVEGDSVQIKTLDSFNLKPDFIKIDVEGFEYFVCLGGEQTIRTYKPVMVVEQKPGKGKVHGLGDTDAIDLLVSWGAQVKEVISGDYIIAWK